MGGRYQRTAPGGAVRLDTSRSSGNLPPPVTEGNVVLTRRSRGPVEVVELSGTLDAWSEPDARAALLAVVREGGGRLVLDLAGLRRIDSSGLSALLSVLKAARSAGGDVVLLSPSATVVSVLRLTRLDRVLETFEDEEAAFARLSS